MRILLYRAAAAFVQIAGASVSHGKLHSALKVNASFTLVLRIGKLPGPFFCPFYCAAFVRFPMLCYLIRKRVIGIRGTHQGLNAQKNCSDLQSRTPLIFEDIQTNSAQFVNIWVVDFSQKPHFRRSHRIIIGQKKFQLKDSTFVSRLLRSSDYNVEVSEVVVVRTCAYAWRRFLQKSLGLLCDSFW